MGGAHAAGLVLEESFLLLVYIEKEDQGSRTCPHSFNSHGPNSQPEHHLPAVVSCSGEMGVGSCLDIRVKDLQPSMAWCSCSSSQKPLPKGLQVVNMSGRGTDQDIL